MRLLSHYRMLLHFTFNRFKEGEYAKMQDYFARVFLHDIRPWASLEGKRMLDVGGGHGVFCRTLEERLPGSDLINLEPSRNLPGWVWPKTVHAKAEAIPFPDEDFDAVLCIGVIEHLPPDAKVQALAEMRRVLKPGGLCYILTQPWWNPNAGHHLKPFHVLPFSWAKRLRRLFFGTGVRGNSYAEEELHPVTYRSMLRMIRDSGLRYERGLDVHLKLHFMTRIPLLREILVPAVGFVCTKPRRT
jgi:ubiquinone/menaquinone biosynthesis C-methylase UbiE